MHYAEGDADKLKHKFWKTMADSPFVFLERKEQPGDAVVMTAQLDRDANSAIWFFTKRDHHLSKMGAAFCTFAGKGHEIFARFEGQLSEETSRERLEEHWSNTVEAWYDQGKNDPKLLMLRMDLGEAEIWDSDLGTISNTKLLLGMDVREEAAEHHAKTTL